ncbi:MULTISPECIES: hypothetical protein [Rhodobacterales]|uniref:hypothetical protein n=1 Tax=Rhodobacterales TaxID=204455 RepID=UPI0011BF8703|nr:MULTISPECIES: hypothetical protein [Rhodobacterales]MDO6589444.1 hypothetical protein [Yoonia sp. 1_MG-2023]
MLIKMKRSQSCGSGVYRAGLIYEVDEKNVLQKRDVDQMIARGFTVETSKKELASLEKKAAAEAAKVAADTAAAVKSAEEKAIADIAAAVKAVEEKAVADMAAAVKAAEEKAAAQKAEAKDSAARGGK